MAHAEWGCASVAQARQPRTSANGIVALGIARDPLWSPVGSGCMCLIYVLWAALAPQVQPAQQRKNTATMDQWRIAVSRCRCCQARHGGAGGSRTDNVPSVSSSCGLSADAMHRGQAVMRHGVGGRQLTISNLPGLAHYCQSAGV